MKLYKQMLLFTLLLILTQVSCTRQNTKAADAGKSQQADAPVKTVEMKTVTDHFGNTVEIPTDPKRIASLHTLSTTHMLWDLEAPLIGTATRLKAEDNNRPYIRSVEEVFNVKFQDTNLFNYGKKGEDIEQIKKSAPDLIVGTQEHSKQYQQLSAIAPTIIISQGTYNMFEIYRDLAEWVNKTAVFEQKRKQYLDKLAKTKTLFSQVPSKQTIAYALPLAGKAMFEARKHYGALTHVAYDLGFKIEPFIAQQFPKEDDIGGKLSAEYLPQIQADWLFSTYNNQRGETPETVYSGFDDIAPGWKDFIPAYQAQKIVVFPRESSRPMSFRVLDIVLDEFAKYAK